jgi:hypothetical protein
MNAKVSRTIAGSSLLGHGVAGKFMKHACSARLRLITASAANTIATASMDTVHRTTIRTSLLRARLMPALQPSLIDNHADRLAAPEIAQEVILR